MSHVFHRSVVEPPPVAVAGDGAYIIDAAGKRYLDASGGAAVSCLGHSDDAVRDAVADQMSKVAFAHTGFFSSEPAEALGAFLSDVAPAGLSWSYFTSGGSESVETALKMARQYYLEIGQPRRTRFIARRQSYHGNTLGALAVGDHDARRSPFAPLLMDVDHVSPCYPYRHLLLGESHDAYGNRLAAELEESIRLSGPETVCAFVMETVSGASLGAVPPVAGYLEKVRAVCDRHGVLLILDEVMCGMGRTGTTFAFEAERVKPDIVTVAKGLGAGYMPIGAVLVSDAIYDAFRRGSGAFLNGHTYNGHPVACAAALAVQQKIQSDCLLANVDARGKELRWALSARFDDHPNIGDIRGRGLFIGVELVADVLTKEPFHPLHGLAAKVKRHALSNGLICYPNAGCVDGRRGDHILLAPPFILTSAQVGELTEKLALSIEAALDEVFADEGAVRGFAL